MYTKKTTKSRLRSLLANISLFGLAIGATGATGIGSNGAFAADASPEQVPCIQMLEGWYGKDASKFDSLMHQNFIKQGVYTDEKTGKLMTPTMRIDDFKAAIAAPGQKLHKSEWDITAETVDLSGPIATVKVTSNYLIDVCQLGKIDGKWEIVNVIWTLRSQGN